jgi:UDP-N-acetylglucosamine:LPS N-acetylglucosamine transferase
MVVSLVPNFNRALCESLASVLPGVPYVTVLTDLVDHPPHFWIERDQEQHFICGTPRAVAQARAMGHPQTHVHATSGMILRPAFYRPPAFDRVTELRRLGLDPLRPTGLVLFGGHGSKVMRHIAEQLGHVQLILVCGHNDALAARLRALPAAAARHVVGFTDDIPGLMHLSDFFIGKPGPGSLSEAVQLGLPVIVVRNSWTMPQERYNAQWVREHRLGIVLRNFSGIADAVSSLVEGIDGYRQAVRSMGNRAVFEVPQILADILNQGKLPGALLADLQGLAPHR